jgi:predicted MPP superfamily phosphohydrolase
MYGRMKCMYKIKQYTQSRTVTARTQPYKQKVHIRFKMPLHVKLVSDIHLEFYDKYPGIHEFINTSRAPPCSRPPADIICLCGDIGDPKLPSYKQFLEDCANACTKYTFVIMGNHEAYGKSIQQTKHMIQNVCDQVNADVSRTGSKAKIVFLDNNTVEVGNYRFIGTTLWSEIDPTEAWNIRCCISDYSRIQQWGIGETNHQYTKNVAWLKQELLMTEIDDKKAIVLTHHVPLMHLGNPKYADSDLKSAFQSDLSDLIKKYTNTIEYWMYGHNHFSETVKYANTTLISNQAGYHGEGEDNMNNRFDDDLTITLRD